MVVVLKMILNTPRLQRRKLPLSFLFLYSRSTWFSLVIASAHGAVLAQDSAMSTLIDQGQHWQAKGDYERAAQVWNKLLLIEPADTRAMYGLARIALDAKNIEAAQSYLIKMRASDLNSQYIKILEQDIRLSSPSNVVLLHQAHAFQIAGDLERSLEKYKEALAGEAPAGGIAIEYFKAACDSQLACEASVRALEQIAKDSPNKPEVELAIAWDLTRIPDRKQRTQGIERLAKIAALPNAPSFITDYWRQGLLWIESISPAEALLFAVYFKVHPSDTEMRRHYEDGLKTYLANPSGLDADTPLTPGFKALERGDRAFAEAEFSSRLKLVPDDTDALGGLGVIRMQQNRFADALKLLTKAVKMTGGEVWVSALNSARCLALMDEADIAHRAGQNLRARALLQQAVRIDPLNFSAKINLAVVHSDLAEYDAAEKIYREVLSVNKNDVSALRGLIFTLIKKDKLDQAYKLLSVSRSSQVGGIDQLNQLMATYYFAIAKNAEFNEDWISAVSALETAISHDLDNPWLRLELAKIYLAQGRAVQARELLDSLIARQLATSQSNTPSALYAGALLASEQGDWKETAELIERITLKERNAEMRVLQYRAQIHIQIQLAIILAQHDQRAEALALLNLSQSAIGSQPDILGAVASAYADIGDPTAGLNLIRQEIKRAAQPGTEVLLQFGALLLRANQDAECERVLKEIQMRKLSVRERKGFEDLLFTYSVRQADLLLQRGDLTEASTRLVPLLEQRPDDIQANMLQARLYVARGMIEQAIRLYKDIAQKNPESVDVQLGVAKVALQLSDSTYAEITMKKALALAPDDVHVNVSVARMYSEEGKLSRAAELFERAASLQTRELKLLTPVQSPKPVDSEKSIAMSDSIASEIDLVKQMMSPEAFVGLQVRNRDGTSGTSKLNDIEAPVEMRLPFGDGKLSFQATAVSLNAGAVGSDFYARSTFGGGPSIALNQLAGLLPSSDSQQANGVGLSLGYKTRGLSVDAGVTPIGFPYSNFTGGIKIDGMLDRASTLSYGVNVSSRPVTDSVLSFAGSRDSVTGLTSGGVMATGVKAQLGKDLGGYGLTASAGFYTLNGHNVASNTRTDTNLGLYLNLIQAQDETLTFGVNAAGAFYDKNLSGFTYGQGGYFSPQHYYALTLPLNWTQRQGALTYKMSGSVGLQTYSQSASDFFPNNSDLQDAANVAMATALTNKLISSSQATLPAQTSTGAVYNLSAAGEYRLNPYVALGGTVQIDNASNYRQWGAGMYLHFSFYPQQGPAMMPVSAYLSPYGQ